MKKVGVVLLSIVFVVVGFATIFTININQTLIKPSFYKKILNENNSYERLLQTDPKFFVSLFEAPKAEVPKGEVVPKETIGFDKVNLANVIQSIKPDTLKKVVETGIDSALFGFNNAKTTDLKIDLSGIKSDLNSSGDEISAMFAESIPNDFLLFPGDMPYTNLGGLSATIIIVVLVIFLVVLLGLIWLLSESWESRIKTLGVLLFIISLPILIVAILGLYVIPINFSTYPEIAELVLDLIQSLRDGFLSPFLIEALVMGMVALVFYVLAVVVLKKGDKVLATGIKAKNEPAISKS